MNTDLYSYLFSGETNIKRLHLALRNIKGDERTRIINSIAAILTENTNSSITRHAIILLASFFGNKLKKSLFKLYREADGLFEIAKDASRRISCKDLYLLFQAVENESQKYQVLTDDRFIKPLLEEQFDISDILNTISCLNSRSHSYYILVSKARASYANEISFLYFSISKAIPSFNNYVTSVLYKITKFTDEELSLFIELFNIDFPESQSKVGDFIVSCFDFAEKIENTFGLNLSDNFYKTLRYIGRQNELDPYFKTLTFNNILDLLTSELNISKTKSGPQSPSNIIISELFTESLFDYLTHTKGPIIAQFTRDIFTNCRINDETNLNIKVINNLLIFFGFRHLKKNSFNTTSEQDINPQSIEKNGKNLTRDFDIKLSPIVHDAVIFEKYINKQEKTTHIKYQNLRPEQSKFRAAVLSRYGIKCSVCNLKIESLIESAHIIEKNAGGSDDPLNGIPLCSLHHKAFDSGLFGIHPQSMKIIPKPGKFTKKELLIAVDDITHLSQKPANETLVWRWNKWIKEL